MKTPRELTSRVCPASSRLPLSRNLTEIGKSSENRRMDRLSGCGCAMPGLQCYGSVGLILAQMAGISMGYSAGECPQLCLMPEYFGGSDKTFETQRNRGSGGKIRVAKGWRQGLHLKRRGRLARRAVRPRALERFASAAMLSSGLERSDKFKAPENSSATICPTPSARFPDGTARPPPENGGDAVP